MSGHSVNKSMDRADLFAPGAEVLLAEIDQLIRTLYARGIPMTSWYGSLPPSVGPAAAVRGRQKIRAVLDRLSLRSPPRELDDFENRGGDDYEPLPGAADDARIPWFLYWEILWVLQNGPKLTPGLRVLDAGGTASLFSSFLASQKVNVSSVDLNERLVSHGNTIAQTMNWELRSFAMDMASMDFDDESFDHAYSICVFEHLDYDLRQRALREIARCLVPGGTLSVTFDYRGPGVALARGGLNYEAANLLRTPADIERNFLNTGMFEVMGNPNFDDNGQSYLKWPGSDDRYTFGALFLRRI